MGPARAQRGWGGGHGAARRGVRPPRSGATGSCPEGQAGAQVPPWAKQGPAAPGPETRRQAGMGGGRRRREERSEDLQKTTPSSPPVLPLPPPAPGLSAGRAPGAHPRVPLGRAWAGPLVRGLSRVPWVGAQPSTTFREPGVEGQTLQRHFRPPREARDRRAGAGREGLQKLQAQECFPKRSFEMPSWLLWAHCSGWIGGGCRRGGHIPHPHCKRRH